MISSSIKQLISVSAATLTVVSMALTTSCRPSANETEEIHIAVISQAIAAREDPSSLYFLSVGQQQLDPDPAFLVRIQRTNPQVRLGSLASKTHPYLERGTGKEGVTIWISDPKFSTFFTKATVELGIQVGFLAGGGSEIYLKKVRGQWQVIGVKPTWMS